MESPVIGQHHSLYSVAIPVFEGPLDLLLHLIERAELDITKVALAQVTDQYLAHINNLPVRNPDDVSSFLVIASKLIQIKSEALLPRPPIREEGEEDPAETLARQLMVYKRYKELSIWLANREAEGLQTYVRLAPPPKIEGKIDLEGIGVADLMHAAREVFTRTRSQAPIGSVVVAYRVSIRDKIRLIINTLRNQRRSGFLALLGKSRSRLEVVVTFLAILELVKRRHVEAHQNKLFDEIELTPAENWQEDEDFELEFDD